MKFKVLLMIWKLHVFYIQNKRKIHLEIDIKWEYLTHTQVHKEKIKMPNDYDFEKYIF